MNKISYNNLRNKKYLIIHIVFAYPIVFFNIFYNPDFAIPGTIFIHLILAAISINYFISKKQSNLLVTVFENELLISNRESKSKLNPMDLLFFKISTNSSMYSYLEIHYSEKGLMKKVSISIVFDNISYLHNMLLKWNINQKGFFKLKKLIQLF